MTFNPGVRLIRWTRAEDYTAGELNEPFQCVPTSRWVDGSQWHALTFLGSSWAQRDTRWPTEQWVAWVRKVVAREGVVTLDMGPNWNPQAGAIGSLAAAQVNQVKAIKVALEQPAARTARSQTRYEPTWDSLDKRPTPEWYLDAKFGVFIHWGVYAVPAWGAHQQYAEWYWNNMANKKPDNPWWQFHKRVYGENFEYKDFAPLFKAELFDADRWADLFDRSGVKYVVPTSKHHEGFCLWPSADANAAWGRPWNSVDVGPKRDLLGELATAVRKKPGMHMGFYYSLYEWFNPLWLTDKPAYVSRHMHPQFKDVVTRYSPDIIFSDGEWDLTSAEWKSPELLAWLFNESPCKDTVVVDDRWGKECRHHHGTYYTTEYGAGMKDASHPWEESRGMAYSYGYNRAERIEDYKTAQEFVLTLVDLVSRGGNFLLDIGPCRWHHSARHGRAPVANGRLAEGQRRGHLRHPPRWPRLPVDRGQASGARLRRVPRRVQADAADRLRAQEWSGRQAGVLHAQGNHTVCHNPLPAGK